MTQVWMDGVLRSGEKLVRRISPPPSRNPRWMNGHFRIWVWYGIGTMFSLAVLSFTVSMISKLLGAVAVSYAAQYLTMLAASASPQGVSSMAMQQGGLGLLMTLFLITVPPMAAAFFQGTVGQFMAYNAFGQGQAMQPAGPGGGYVPASGGEASNPTSTNVHSHKGTVA